MNNKTDKMTHTHCKCGRKGCYRLMNDTVRCIQCVADAVTQAEQKR